MAIQKKYTIIGLFAVLFIICVYLNLTKENKALENEVVVETPVAIEYYDENGSVATILNKSETEFTFSGLGYEPTIFTLDETSIEGGYKSANSELIIWKVGTEISLYDGPELVYVGNSVESVVTEQPELTPTESNQGRLSAYKWLWVKTELTGGTSVEPRNPELFGISFATTGSVQGTTDCNSFFGEYKLSDKQILFSPLASTKMYCENSQEADFVSAINQAGEVSFNETEDLTLLLKDGAGKITFKKELIDQ